MSAGLTDTTAISAPGKVLLAGGYLVLDRAYTGVVFGLSARINAIAQTICTSPGVQLNEIVVDSPQFREAEWTYGYHLADADGGILVTQLRTGTAVRPNAFVETTLSYALTYVSRMAQLSPAHSITSSRITILADNDYYSQPADAAVAAASAPGGRFSCFATTLSDAHKTGLGSSAALVTALTGAVLSHYLPPELFDLSTSAGRDTLHNLAQAAHCAAQGKVGSGFDVAAAVYGSCVYRRFSPSVLARLPELGRPGFAGALMKLVRSGETVGEAVGETDACSVSSWDTEIVKDDGAASADGGVALPPGVAVRMCDVDCGSQTVGMVKQVLAWRAREPEAARALWDALQARNAELAAVLRRGAVDALPAALQAVRALVRQMGDASGVPIEPASQTALLDAVTAYVDGVYGGVVPGAGGYDAVCLLVRDDPATAARLDAFLAQWSSQNAARVRLLAVKGEMEGVRREDRAIYTGWLEK